MYVQQYILVSALVAYTSAHGVLRSITGVNGVLMPGLSVVDGTPRGASSAGSGAEADVSIIKDNDKNPLGRTPGSGAVDPTKVISTFMGGAGGAGKAVAADTAAANTTADTGSAATVGGAAAGSGGGKAKGRGRHKHQQGAKERRAGGGNDLETIVGDTAGKGATSGLPTVGDDGSISLTYHQVNGDGAGPVTAEVDSTSGGIDAKAFQTAQVTKQVPGTNGNSGAAATDFTMTVKVPAGTTCDGTVAGVNNVCIIRVRNPSGAGPFGGSAAFTQSKAARKRAIAYRLKKRMEIRV